jgi:glycerol uptake facilitator-like aquaporin
VTCAETSGGHFHPGLTISYITFKGFPFWKGMRYIVAQIVGAYLAFAFIYIQWRPSILVSATCCTFLPTQSSSRLSQEAEEHLKAKGMYETSMFTPHGPAGIFAPYAPAGYSMGTLFLNEFVVDFVIGVVVFCIHDPTTIRVNPALLPWIAAFTA